MKGGIALDGGGNSQAHDVPGRMQTRWAGEVALLGVARAVHSGSPGIAAAPVQPPALLSPIPTCQGRPPAGR